MERATLRVDVDGAQARLTLTRPEVRNALSREALADLVDAAAWIDARPEIRVVTLAGQGPAFCAGADLDDLAAALDSDADDATRLAAAHLGAQMADAIEGLRAMTVARLHGHVVGGGCVLALACDLRIAASDATFAIPEVDLGIPLGWGGLHRLVRDIGPMRAKELVTTGRAVDATEAAATGLVTRTVTPDDLDAAVDDLVATLLAKPADPLTTTKAQVAAITGGQAPAAATAAATDALVAAVRGPAFAELAQAYRHRRLRRRGPDGTLG